MNIANHVVGEGAPPFIIAELSGNHNHSLERALALVDAAAQAGVHAVKLQTYNADTMTLDVEGEDFVVGPEVDLWAGRHLYELYQEASTPWEWHEAIFERCAERGLIAFSTPFDGSAVAFLESLGVPAYKIASFENADLPLLREVGSTGKPVILSTGMASVAEIDESVRTLRESGCQDLILLKCTSTYPATPEHSNLRTLPHLRELFGCPVGLSDHTLGIGSAVASVALGACVIEKHFTLRRADGGVDSAFSMEPEEMTALVRETYAAWQALGRVHYGAACDAESKSRQFRRSLYVAEDMQAGEAFTPQNLRIVRPGFGLEPKYYACFLGKKANRSLKKGTPIDWSFIG